MWNFIPSDIKTGQFCVCFLKGSNGLILSIFKIKADIILNEPQTCVAPLILLHLSVYYVALIIGVPSP